MRAFRNLRKLNKLVERHQSAALIRKFSGKDSAEEGVVSIDRTRLFNPDPHSHDPIISKEPETELAKQLKALIRFRGGPITVAEYMSEALTNQTAGYYMRQDVFGEGGDFITSPEISQLFGEMVGIWCVLQWQKLGSPAKMRLVELGPGRGTLMADLLRGTSSFTSFSKAINVDLVEVSEALRKIQRKTLDCTPPRDWSKNDKTLNAVSKINNAQVRWYKSLVEVPEDIPAIYVAHEFFDALPVHQFVKGPRGWCERLVDIAGPESRLHLRMVLSPGPTPASSLLLKRKLDAMPAQQREEVQHIEVSAQSIALAESLSKRIARHKGAALVVDYGQEGHFASSVQAIKGHKFMEMLSRPGEADLSSRVDFSAIRQGVAESNVDVTAHGPMPQAYFLAGLGIEARLESLVKGSPTEEAQNRLVSGYNRLVGGAEPGSESLASPESPANQENQESLARQDPTPDSSLEPAKEKLDQSLEKFLNTEPTEVQSEGLPTKEGVNAEPLDPKAEQFLKEVDKLAEKLSQPYEEEGMGHSYKVLAIVAKDQEPPVPFPGSGVEFED